MAEFEELAQQLRTGDNARVEAAATIRLMLSDIQSTVDKLEYIHMDAKKFHENCNTAKTVGTVSNIAGAASAIGKMFVASNHF